MVAIRVGVDERPNRRSAHERLQGIEHSAREVQVEEGVDEEGSSIGDDQAGIAPTPTPIRLDVGETTLSHVLNHGTVVGRSSICHVRIVEVRVVEPPLGVTVDTRHTQNVSHPVHRVPAVLDSVHLFVNTRGVLRNDSTPARSNPARAGRPASGAVAGQKTFDDIGTPLADVTFCVIDFETTGGSSDFDRITEIGAAKYRSGECLGTFQTLINPECPIPPFITVLTGITEAMLLPAPRIESILPTFLEFIGDAVIVAHNARFDMGFLNASLIRDGREAMTNKVVDTVHLARRLVRDEVPDCKLGTLASRLRLAHQPSHRALDDVLATGDLLHLLIERAAGFGVLGLDDLISLPRLETHPLAAKLGLTEDLPRSPGVYMFIDGRDRVLYVGKATNLRQRVRSYFSTSESRRKVGSMLRQVQSIAHIATPDPLTASVYESRLIQRLLPQYNRVGTTVDKYCYVRLTLDEEWPRLIVTKSPSTSRHGLYIGPLTSRTAARQVIEAIESVVPLRRCTARLGRSYVPPQDAPVCSAAQLGVARCPCSGTADRDEYQGIVRFVVDALTSSPSLLFERLHERMSALSSAQRYEEAASMRDRIQSLETALSRQRKIEEFRRAERIELRIGEVEFEVEHGCLVATRSAGQLLFPLVVAASGKAPVRLDIDVVLNASSPIVEPSMPLPGSALDEMLNIWRYFEDHADSARLVSCSGNWSTPLALVPTIGDVKFQRAA